MLCCLKRFIHKKCGTLLVPKIKTNVPPAVPSSSVQEAIYILIQLVSRGQQFLFTEASRSHRNPSSE